MRKRNAKGPPQQQTRGRIEKTITGQEAMMLLHWAHACPDMGRRAHLLDIFHQLGGQDVLSRQAMTVEKGAGDQERSRNNQN